MKQNNTNKTFKTELEKLLGVPVLAGIGENKELAKLNGGRKHHETR